MPGKEDRYKKIVADTLAVDNLKVDLFLDAHSSPPEEIHLDCTDDPLHGNQKGRFFRGRCGCYRYLPLYVVCGDHVLCSRLRPSNVDGAAGSVEELSRIVERQALAANQGPRRRRAATGRGATTTMSTTCSACPATPV